MSASGLTQTVLASQLLEAIRKDSETGINPFDITLTIAKLRDGATADWIRMIADEFVRAAGVELDTESLPEKVRTLEEENKALRSSLENMLKIAEHGIPGPSHEGTCGPWAQCDGNCEARAYCAEHITEARRLVGPGCASLERIQQIAENGISGSSHKARPSDPGGRLIIWHGDGIRDWEWVEGDEQKAYEFATENHKHINYGRAGYSIIPCPMRPTAEMRYYDQ